MRIAAIDIGSNSTRLLVADVVDGRIEELFRRSMVTRLADGVDMSGRLADDACGRVHAALAGYRAEMDEAGCEVSGGVATSAVRDAANGQDFATAVFERHQIPIQVIDGDRESQLTFVGVSTGPAAEGTGRTLVVDIGGGSTEFIVGEAGRLAFNVSTDIGAVRHSERFLKSDPPTSSELEALLAEAGKIVESSVPAQWRGDIGRGIGVAGTPTVLAAVDQELVPFDPWKVHGYRITRAACESMLDRLASMPLVERREVKGLHPDRAPTIVAGAAILLTAMRAFELDAVEVSEHDLLYGIALELADKTV